MINCHWKRKHLKNLRILILFFRGKGFDHLLFFPCYRLFSLLTWWWLMTCLRPHRSREGRVTWAAIWCLNTTNSSEEWFVGHGQKFNHQKTPGWFQLETGQLYDVRFFTGMENLHQISHLWICQASMVGMRPLAASSGWSSGVVSAGNWNHWQFATWNWRGRVEIYLWPEGPDVSRKFLEKVVSGGFLAVWIFLRFVHQEVLEIYIFQKCQGK